MSNSICDMTIPKIPYFTTPLAEVHNRALNAWTTPMPDSWGAWWCRVAERIAMIVPGILAGTFLLLTALAAKVYYGCQEVMDPELPIRPVKLTKVQQQIAEVVKKRIIACTHCFDKKKPFLFYISIQLENQDCLKITRLVAGPRLIKPGQQQFAANQLYAMFTRYLADHPIEIGHKTAIDFIAVLHDINKEFGYIKSTTAVKLSKEDADFNHINSQTCTDFEGIKWYAQKIPGLLEKLSVDELIS